jgi:hypothetical protein
MRSAIVDSAVRPTVVVFLDPTSESMLALQVLASAALAWPTYIDRRILPELSSDE